MSEDKKILSMEELDHVAGGKIVTNNDGDKNDGWKVENWDDNASMVNCPKCGAHALGKVFSPKAPYQCLSCGTYFKKVNGQFVAV